MNPAIPSAAKRYDDALRRARHTHLPPDHPIPQFTAAWPPENIALLEHYRQWLLSSGTSPDAVKTIYLPMAGHVFGLTLKPHPQLDLDADLNRALAYIHAKRLSGHWNKVCRIALERFRRFMRHQRGQLDLAFPAQPLNLDRYWTGLPPWLVDALKHYQRLQQRNWRPARLQQQTVSFWRSHTALWQWLFARYPLAQITAIKRDHIHDYVDHCLSAGYAISTINNHLRSFQATLRHLQAQDYYVPQALLRLPGLKEPDRLPRFLHDEQVRRLRDDLEGRAAKAQSPAKRRDALLDRAVFYLLWQAGLRLAEVEDLRLDDLDLAGRRLSVRQGKNRTDRTLYLTDSTVRAVQAYLSVRGLGQAEPLFLYRHRALRKDLIHSRIQAAGRRVGVNVSPHQLRHTFATQLLNAGCPVTSIQKLLGHQRLNSTMIYARVHNRTVAEDYYAAMGHIEGRLNLAPDDRQAPDQLLNLLDRLQADPLTGSQQETVAALRTFILELAEPPPTAIPLELPVWVT